jgi:hypothetical protein
MDTDLSGLRSDIARAFLEGGSLSITVEMGDDPTNTGTLILNGNATPFVTIAEAPADPDPEPVLDIAG